MGAAKGSGAKVGQMMRMVAANVKDEVIVLISCLRNGPRPSCPAFPLLSSASNTTSNTAKGARNA